MSVMLQMQISIKLASSIHAVFYKGIQPACLLVQDLDLIRFGACAGDAPASATQHHTERMDLRRGCVQVFLLVNWPELTEDICMSGVEAIVIFWFGNSYETHA